MGLGLDTNVLFPFLNKQWHNSHKEHHISFEMQLFFCSKESLLIFRKQMSAWLLSGAGFCKGPLITSVELTHSRSCSVLWHGWFRDLYIHTSGRQLGKEVICRSLKLKRRDKTVINGWVNEWMNSFIYSSNVIARQRNVERNKNRNGLWPCEICSLVWERDRNQITIATDKIKLQGDLWPLLQEHKCVWTASYR